MHNMTARPHGGEAVLSFTISSYDLLQPGEYVRCAVTEQPIPLDALRYWNADLQEAYIDAEAMLQRYEEARGARDA